MNFLFDNNLPAPLADALRLLNKPVVHVRGISELGAAAPDDLILDYAVTWNYTVVTHEIERCASRRISKRCSARASWE